MTQRAKDGCLRLCVESSYAAVSEALERLWESAPAPETLRQAAVAEGEALRGQQRRHAEAVVNGEVTESKGARPKTVYVTVDGGYVRGRGKRQWHEGKLGSVVTQRAVRVSKDRHRLLGRRNVGTFQGASALGELAYAAAFEAGVQRAEQVVVLGDGAQWIQTIQEEHFPQAELRLDAFHVLQALSRGLEAAYPKDRKRRGEKGERLRELIWAGQLPEALRRLRLMEHYAPGDAGALRETIGYLERHGAFIPAYGELQARGEMISSALAEEGVDRLLNARFKHQHRHWRPKSADALLALRLLATSGEWPSYWHSLRKAA